MADILDFTHPELKRRWGMFVGDCWERSWNPVATSASRSHDTQAAWYALDQQGLWPTGPVANPDQVWGKSPFNWIAYGSLHMIQSDGYSHALDVTIQGATRAQYEPVARKRGLRLPEPGEYWHLQWWDLNGIYPIELENDMTLEEFARGIGRYEPDGEGSQGSVRIIDGVIKQKLDDGNWWPLADVWEFTHRHIKHLDEKP